MSLIKNIYRHEKTKYVFGFGGPKKPSNDGKQRNPRHSVLKWCLTLSSLTTFVKLMITTVGWLSRAEKVPVFLNYPSPNFHAHFRAALGLEIAFILVATLQAWNFLAVWHRRHHGKRRSMLVAAADVLLIALAAADVGIVESMIAAAPSTADVQAAFPDLAADDIRVDAFNKLDVDFYRSSRGSLALACIDAAIHASAIAFWHWLLPPVWRFPDNYEPVVREKRGKRAPGMLGGDSHSSLPSSVELGELEHTNEASDGQMSLASHYRDQERRRAAAGHRPVEDSVNGPQGRRISLGSRERRSPGTGNGLGPRFAPQVQYWAFGTVIFNFVMRLLGPAAVVTFIIETILYAVTRSSGLQCSWSCHLAFVWVLLAALLVATVITLVRFCVPLDYRLGGKLRIDLALMLIEVPFAILGFVTHLYRLTNGQGSNREQGQGSLAIAGFRFVVSLFWLACTACGIFVLPVMVWKNYYRRRRAASKSQ